MKFKNRALIIFTIILVCIVCDRITKHIAKQNLPEHKIISLLYDTIRLQYAENTGAFLSLGSNISEPARYYIFTILVGLFLVALLAYLLSSRQSTRWQITAMSLVLGGGFGNLIDRIGHGGRVFDFLNVGIGSLRTGIFNIADLGITIGAIWFFILAVLLRDKPARRQTAGSLQE